MNRFLKVISCLFVSTFLLASAQVPYVPAELLDNAVRMQGDRVSICVFGGLDTTEFDRAATALIAEALLIDHVVTEIPSDFPLYDEVDFFYTLYIHLVNDCDMIAGLSLTAGIYPEWLAITGAVLASITSRVVSSERCETSTIIPSRFISATTSRPNGLSPFHLRSRV